MVVRGVAATWRLLRPGNALVAAAAAVVGAVLAVDAAPLVPVALAALASFAFAAAGNVRNDLGDVALDRVAHPTRPLVTGAVPIPLARGLALLLYATALAAGAWISWPAFVLVLLAVPIMESYERRFKAEGLPGNLVVALLTAAPFVLGGVAVGRVGPALLAVAALAALATLGREVLKDIEDARADEGTRRTLPHRVGARVAGRVAGAALVAAVLLSPLPFFLERVLGWGYIAAVGAADACFLAAATWGASRAARGQRLSKLGMVLALVALVVGRLQVA